MSEQHWTERLRELSACPAAVTWAAAYPTIQAAWDACERGDYMLWLCGKYAGKPWSDARRPLVLCACECARLALARVQAGEDRPRLAIECAESWARGEHNDPKKVSYASAAYAAADAARSKTLKTCADIVRRHYPKAPETPK